MRVHGKHTCIPPDAVARNTRAPFLFKYFHVEYNEATNRLDTPSSEEGTEYDDILVEATDQTDLPGKCIQQVRKNMKH